MFGLNILGPSYKRLRHGGRCKLYDSSELMKWKSASSVICDRKVSLKLKGKFYCTTMRPVMLYEIE